MIRKKAILFIKYSFLIFVALIGIGFAGAVPVPPAKKKDVQEIRMDQDEKDTENEYRLDQKLKK